MLEVESILSSLSQIIVSGYEGIVSEITKSLNNLVNSITKPLWCMVETGKNIIVILTKTVSDYVFNTISLIIGTLPSLWSILIKILRRIGEFIWNGLTWVGQQILNSLQWLGQQFIGFINWVWNGLQWLGQQILNGLQWVWNGIINLANCVWNGLQWLGKMIYNAISGFINWLWSGLQWLWGQITGFYSWLLQQFAGFIQFLFKPVFDFIYWVWNGLQYLQPIFQFLLQILLEFLSDPLAFVWEKIIVPAMPYIQQFFLLFANTMRSILQPVAGMVLGAIHELVDLLIVFAMGTVFTMRPDHATASWVLNLIRSAVEYAPPATPSKAWGAAANYLSIVLGMAMSQFAWTMAEKLVGLVASAKILGTGLGDVFGGGGGEFASLFRSIQFGLGLNWLTWIIFGQMFRAVIADPLERYYRQTYRSTYPTRTMVEEWLRRGLISDSQFMNEMRKLGYPEEYLGYILKSSYREVSLSMYLDMREYGLISEADLMNAINNLGYPPEIRGLIFEYAKIRVLDARIRRLRERMARAYVEGYYHRDYVVSALISLGLPQEYVDSFISSYDVDHDIEIRELVEKTMFEAYEKGMIDEDELRNRLASVIADPHILELKILYAKLKKMPKERLPNVLTLEERKKTLQVKVASLNAQLQYLMARRKENAEYWRARISYEKTKYESDIRRIREETQAEIERIQKRTQVIVETLQSLCQAYINARIEQLESKLKVLETKLKVLQEQYTRKLEEASEEEREKILQEFEEKKMLLEAQIQLLIDLTRTRVEERKAVCEARIKRYQELAQADIERLKAKMEVRIKEFKKEMEAKLKLLQEQFDKEDAYFAQRISKLQGYLEETKTELDIVNSLLARFKVAG